MSLTDKTMRELAENIASSKYTLKDIHDALVQADEYREALLKLSPLQVGDVAVLCETPNINERDSWGWMPYKHFLVKGEKCTVNKVEFYKGSFRYSVVFDNHSWMDSKGNINLVDKKGLFTFSEKFLVKV